MLEPMMLPSASWVFFLNAAATDAASSGREVPHAMRVSDMNASLTPKDFATDTALSTKKSQLVISTARPTATFPVAIQMDTFSSWPDVSESCAFFMSRRKEYHMKNAKSNSRIRPSGRPMVAGVPLKKFMARSISRTDTAMQNGISNLTLSLLIAIGKKRAVSPRIPSTLNMLDPTTLPIATSAFP